MENAREIPPTPAFSAVRELGLWHRSSRARAPALSFWGFNFSMTQFFRLFFVPDVAHGRSCCSLRPCCLFPANAYISRVENWTGLRASPVVLLYWLTHWGTPKAADAREVSYIWSEYGVRSTNFFTRYQVFYNQFSRTSAVSSTYLFWPFVQARSAWAGESLSRSFHPLMCWLMR